MQTNHLVLVGAVNWAHSAWRGAFYPVDLPDDWMLSYYNSCFQSVYLPSGVWREASPETWSKWLDDTLPGFRFVLEPGSGDDAPPASERVLRASPEWAAAHLWWIDENPDLRALAQCITRHAAACEPLYVFSRSGDLALLEQVNALKQVMGY
jgi:hypothetical protein